MQIIFDPYDVKDTRSVMQHLKKIGVIAEATQVPLIDLNELDVNTVAAEPAPTAAGPDVDARGMPHDPAIHAKTKTKDKDGFWKAMRGKADEAKAAIDAFGAPAYDPPTGNAGMPATGMPGMPQMPVADIPPAPVSYDEMVKMFIGMMEDGTITDAGAVYADVGVTDPNELQTNETLRAAMVAHLKLLSA